MNTLTEFRAAIQPAADLLVTEVRAAYARFTTSVDAALIDHAVEQKPKDDQDAFATAVLNITTDAARRIEESR